jgi:hypothetical protein
MERKESTDANQNMEQVEVGCVCCEINFKIFVPKLKTPKHERTFDITDIAIFSPAHHPCLYLAGSSSWAWCVECECERT